MKFLLLLCVFSFIQALLAENSNGPSPEEGKTAEATKDDPNATGSPTLNPSQESKPETGTTVKPGEESVQFLEHPPEIEGKVLGSLPEGVGIETPKETSGSKIDTTAEKESVQFIEHAPEIEGKVVGSLQKGEGIGTRTETSGLRVDIKAKPGPVEFIEHPSEIEGKVAGSLSKGEGVGTATETGEAKIDVTAGPESVQFIEHPHEIEGKVAGSVQKGEGIDTRTEGTTSAVKQEALVSKETQTSGSKTDTTAEPGSVQFIEHAPEIEGKVAEPLSKGVGIGTLTKTSESKSGTTAKQESVEIIEHAPDIEGKVVGSLQKGEGIGTRTETTKADTGAVDATKLIEKTTVSKDKEVVLPSKSDFVNTGTEAEDRATTLPTQPTQKVISTKGSGEGLLSTGSQMETNLPIKSSPKPTTQVDYLQENAVNIASKDNVETSTDSIHTELEILSAMGPKGRRRIPIKKTTSVNVGTRRKPKRPAKTSTASQGVRNVGTCGNDLRDMMLLRNWNVRYIREDNSEVEHLLIMKRETWAKARKICNRAGMELGTFADDTEFAYVTRSMHGLCISCSKALWIKGTRRGDVSKCKFVHLKEIDPEEKFCSKSYETQRNSFVCTKQIGSEPSGINVTLRATVSSPRTVYPQRTAHVLYTFFAKPTTWYDAKRQCERRQMHLAKFRDDEEKILMLKIFQESCPGCTGSYWVNGRRRESVRVMRAKRQLPPYSTPVPWEPSWPKLDRQQRPWWHHHEEWPKYQAPRWDFHGNTLNPHFQDPWVPPENRFQQKWMDICYSLSLQSKEFSEVPCSQLPGELKDRNTELRGYICLKRENGA